MENYRGSRKRGAWLLVWGLILALQGFTASIAWAHGGVHPEMEDDWANDSGGGGEWIVSGNPLDEGDLIYTLNFLHRVRDTLGLQVTVGWAESSLFEVGGDEPELRLLDLSLVKFLYRRHLSEYFVFGGAGIADLRTDSRRLNGDPRAFEEFTFADGSREYFTLHAGIGAKIYIPKTHPDGWSYRSHFFVRPEVKVRWFDRDDSVDTSIGLSLGYSFGRPTRAILGRQVEEIYQQTEDVATATEEYLGEIQRAYSYGDVWCRLEKAVECGHHLSHKLAEVLTCGERCGHLLDPVTEALEMARDSCGELRDEMARQGGVGAYCCAERQGDAYSGCAPIDTPTFQCFEERVDCLEGEVSGDRVKCSRPLGAEQRSVFKRSCD